jgi:hypothetical protein
VGGVFGDLDLYTEKPLTCGITTRPKIMLYSLQALKAESTLFLQPQENSRQSIGSAARQRISANICRPILN